MDPIAEIQNQLTTEQASRAEVTRDGLTIPAATPAGFDVEIYRNRDTCIVAFDGWHEHFNDGAEAVKCFLFGLNGECRLEVVQYGKRAYKWTLETKTEDGWQADATTGLIFVPFWLKKTVSYKSNQ